jgi:ABC-type glycerol-3-phosphate transport system substrate-binding protein
MSTRHYRKAAAVALVAGLALSVAACSSSKKTSSESSEPGKVTITVDCMPVDAQATLKKDWLDDVAAFEKLHPTITIESKSVGSQCDNPPDFTARLRGGTMSDVFYAYMTDKNQVLDSGQVMDISKFITDKTVPTWSSIDASAKSPFQDGGKTYGIPTKNYNMGLVINKNLFAAAGLDPKNPPTTWQDVAKDAKLIADKAGASTYGYADYSAGNTGGWHFTAELYSRGGQMVADDGKTAAFNTPAGQAVLQNLKDMRWTDNSAGQKQLLQWPDLLTQAAAGKVGMFVGAPDAVTAIVTNFKGKYSDWAMGPIPGDNGKAVATLGGGEGYFFKKGLSDDQVKAGLLWLSYEKLTSGVGQFNYARSKAEADPTAAPVGLPEPFLFVPGSAAQKADDTLKAANATIDMNDYAPFTAAAVPTKVEPPQAQAIYAVLDGAMSAVLTDKNADPAALLSTAEKKVNTILSTQQ